MAIGRHIIPDVPDRMMLTGEIKNVWQRRCAVPRCGTDVSAIIDELEREVSYKDAGRAGKIGFL